MKQSNVDVNKWFNLSNVHLLIKIARTLFLTQTHRICETYSRIQTRKAISATAATTKTELPSELKFMVTDYLNCVLSLNIPTFAFRFHFHPVLKACAQRRDHGAALLQKDIIQASRQQSTIEIA
jgi:hypothetical protein